MTDSPSHPSWRDPSHDTRSRRRNRRSITEYLLPGLIAAAALVISIVFLLLGYMRRGEETAELRHRHQHRMELYSNLVEGLTDEVFSTLRLVSALDAGLTDSALAGNLKHRFASTRFQKFPLDEIYLVYGRDRMNRLTTLHWDSLGYCVVARPRHLSSETELLNQTSLEGFRAKPYRESDLSFIAGADSSSPENSTGLLLSVPMRQHDSVVGIVSGFLSGRVLAEFLERGDYMTMVAVMDGTGHLIGCSDFPDADRNWLSGEEQRARLTTPCTEETPAPVFDRWTTLWSPLTLSSNPRWWLVYQYDRDGLLQGGFASESLRVASSVATFLLGLMLALMVLRLRRRNAQLGKLVNDIRGRELALEQTISQLNATLEASADGLLAMSDSGVVVNFNRRLFTVWKLDENVWPFGREGNRPEAMASQVENVRDFLCEPEPAATASGDQAPVILRLKDGRLIEQTSIEQTVDDVRVGTVWSFRDVTARERSDAAIKQHLAFLQDLIDAIPNPVYYKDIKGQYLGCNKAFEQVIGRSRDDIIGKSVIEVGGVPFAHQYYGHDSMVLKDRSIQNFEGPLVYADGTVHQVVFYKAVFFNGDESLGGMVGALVDITERKFAETALRESEAKYRTMFEDANVGIFIMTDLFQDVNQSVADILGCRRVDVIGKSPIAFSPEFQADGRRSTDSAREKIEAALSGERQFFNWVHRTVGGQLIDCEITLNASSLDGRPAILGSMRDISERKRADEVRRQAEIALQRREQYFRGMIENSTDLLTVVAVGGSILYVGPSVSRLLGYDPSALLGKCAYDYMREEDRDTIRRLLRPLLSDQARVQTVTCHLRHRDGSFRVFETLGHSTVDMDGNPVIVLNSRDITERSAIEERVRRSEENYRRLFEDAADGIVVVSPDGRYLDANASACRMLGYQHSDLLAMSARDLRIPRDLDRFDEMKQEVLSGKPLFSEWQFRRGDGSLIDVEVTATLLHDGRVQAFYRDISQRKEAERALRESELWLRTLIEATSDIFFTVDVHRNVISLSPAFERVSGWKIEDWIGRPFTGLIHPEDVKAIDAAMPGIGHEKETNDTAEIRMFARDGSLRTLDIKFAYVRRQEHESVIVGVARDITERREAQAKISKLSRAVEYSPVSVVITDPTGAIEYVNPKFTELTGYTFDEVRGKNPRVLKSGLMHDGVYAELWRTISSGRPWQGDLLNRKKNGETYWEAAFISALTDSQGVITNFVAVKQDISDRIIRELELKKLSAAVVQSANLIVITNGDGLIEYVNPRVSQVSGYRADELIGRPLSSFNSPADETEDPNAMWLEVQAGRTWKDVILNHQKNGQAYYLKRTASPILDDSGDLISVLIICEDISAEMEAQQKATEADKLAAVGVLAAGVSHEFKNYLGGIIGNASFALDEIDAGSQDALTLARDTLSQIIGMSEKANQVAMSLLTYSKARPEEFSPTKLKPLVMNTINLVEKELRNRSIELITYFEDTPEVNASASKIQQLLLNLLLNAEHAIQESGVITVALVADDRFVKLKVGDTGCGIPPANLSRIFDPFFSTKGVWGKDKVVGTGMGLAICRNVAREHHGDLIVESTVGIGTTFTLLIPLYADTGAAEPHRLPGAAARRFVIFSLDKGIIGKYFKDAAGLGVELVALDDLRKIRGNLAVIADLVICDARFSGKIELSRMVSLSLQAGVPYVMVNCGAMEYQLSHLYEQALANFRELPELQRLNALVPEKSVHSASTTL